MYYTQGIVNLYISLFCSQLYANIQFHPKKKKKGRYCNFVIRITKLHIIFEENVNYVILILNDVFE